MYLIEVFGFVYIGENSAELKSKPNEHELLLHFGCCCSCETLSRLKRFDWFGEDKWAQSSIISISLNPSDDSSLGNKCVTHTCWAIQTAHMFCYSPQSSQLMDELISWVMTTDPTISGIDGKACRNSYKEAEMRKCLQSATDRVVSKFCWAMFAGCLWSQEINNNKLSSKKRQTFEWS